MSIALRGCVFCKRSRSRLSQRREALLSAGGELRRVDDETPLRARQPHRSVIRLNDRNDSTPDCEFMPHPGATKLRYATRIFRAGSTSNKTSPGPTFDGSWQVYGGTSSNRCTYQKRVEFPLTKYCLPASADRSWPRPTNSSDECQCDPLRKTSCGLL